MVQAKNFQSPSLLSSGGDDQQSPNKPHMADGLQNYLSPVSGTSSKQINIMMSPQQVTHMKRMITRSGNSVSSNSEDNFVNWDTNQDKLQMKVGTTLKANVIKRLADDRIEPP